MLHVPSKYSVSHYTPPADWIRQHLVSAWNSVPDRFVKPYESERRFAFVCGCGHSGTTLTAAKIGAHSRAFLIGRETNAFSPVFGSHCSRRIVSEWDYFAQSEEKDLVLEKTPKHVHSIAKIRRILPLSKVIITTRNPLDNVASLYARFGNLNGAIGRWIKDNRAIFGLRDLDGIKVVRYEEISSNPREGFSDLFGFLGLDWEPNILDPESTGYDRVDQKGNMAIRAKQVSKPVRPKIDTWKSILTERQVEVVLERTCQLAGKLGYRYSKDRLLVREFGEEGYDEKNF